VVHPHQNWIAKQSQVSNDSVVNYRRKFAEIDRNFVPKCCVFVRRPAIDFSAMVLNPEHGVQVHDRSRESKPQEPESAKAGSLQLTEIGEKPAFCPARSTFGRVLFYARLNSRD